MYIAFRKKLYVICSESSGFFLVLFRPNGLDIFYAFAISLLGRCGIYGVGKILFFCIPNADYDVDE